MFRPRGDGVGGPQRAPGDRPERSVYRAYGLGRSVLRVWSPKVLWRYLRLMLAGRRLKPIQGDPHQLGGDFIVDAGGIVRLAHPSRDPTDRPSVEKFLTVLRDMAGEVGGSSSDASRS